MKKLGKLFNFRTVNTVPPPYDPLEGTDTALALIGTGGAGKSRLIPFDICHLVSSA